MLISLLVISLLSATSSNNLVAASSLRGLVPKTAVEKRTPQESHVSSTRALAGKTVVCHHPRGNRHSKHFAQHINNHAVESHLKNNPDDFLGSCSTDHAADVLDGNDVIFGSGNSNGEFSTVLEQNIELGLRAKEPGEGSTYNDKGGFEFIEGTKWNLEFSVNADTSCSSPYTDCDRYLSDLDYLLEVDTVEGPATNFVVLDPINVEDNCPPFGLAPDHALGFIDSGEDDDSNKRCNGGLVVSLGGYGGWKPMGCNSVYGPTLNDNYEVHDTEYCTPYKQLIGEKTVAQQSWAYPLSWIPEWPVDVDGQVPGIYTIRFSAIDQRNKHVIAQVSINVEVVEEEP